MQPNALILQQIVGKSEQLHARKHSAYYLLTIVNVHTLGLRAGDPAAIDGGPRLWRRFGFEELNARGHSSEGTQMQSFEHAIQVLFEPQQQ